MLKILIEAQRQGYATDQVGDTITAGELIKILEEYEEDTPIFISNDNGYTYGSIKNWDIREEYDKEDEEYEENY